MSSTFEQQFLPDDWDVSDEIVLRDTSLKPSKNQLKAFERERKRQEEEAEYDRQWRERKDKEELCERNENSSGKVLAPTPVQLLSKERVETQKVILVHNKKEPRELESKDIKFQWKSIDHPRVDFLKICPRVIEKEEEVPDYRCKPFEFEFGDPHYPAPIFREENHIKEGQLVCKHGFFCKNKKNPKSKEEKEVCPHWHPAPGYDQKRFCEKRWKYLVTIDICKKIDGRMRTVSEPAKTVEKKMRPRTNSAPASASTSEKKNKTCVCVNNVMGKCKRKDCKLAHDIKDFKPSACRYDGKCTKKNCTYKHSNQTNKDVWNVQVKVFKK